MPVLAPVDSRLTKTWTTLAWSATPVSHTGDLLEVAMATIPIAANGMGTRGILRVTADWSVTPSTNAKSLRVRLGGLAGTIFLAQSTTLATHTNLRAQCQIHNRDVANAQVGHGVGIGGGWGSNSNVVTVGTVDTSLAQDLVITGNLQALASENITLESYLVELLYGA